MIYKYIDVGRPYFKMLKKINKRVIEKLSHFNCSKCKKWWSVSEAPEEKTNWFCPWCGENHVL